MDPKLNELKAIKKTWETLKEQPVLEIEVLRNDTAEQEDFLDLIELWNKEKEKKFKNEG